MEEYRSISLWCVSWFLENEEGLLEDTDFVFAYSEQEAVDKWLRLDDVPEGAEIIDIKQDSEV
jgi:hypothetical protein